MKIGIKDFGPFKKKISKMKMILEELNFIFKEDGLHIKEIDINNDNLIYLHLNRHYFDDYEFSEDISYKINLFNFYHCLKTLSVRDKLYLEFFDNNLRISTIRKKKTQSYYINISRNSNLNLKDNFGYQMDYHNIFQINYSREHKIEDMGDFLFNDISFEVRDKKLFIETKNDDVNVVKEINSINFLKYSSYPVKSTHKYKSIQALFSFLSLGHKNIININDRAPIKIDIAGKNFVLILISSNISTNY